MVKIGKYILSFLKNSTLGAVFVSSWLLSIAAVGWTYRVMQCHTLKVLWQTSNSSGKGCSINEFHKQLSTADSHDKAPYWIRKRRPPHDEEVRGFILRNFGALSKNFKVGTLALLNTWILTLPGCSLWTFSWWGGWNNSFAKGYEMAALGPSLGLFGVLLFVLAMLYVPMAQAHQAATGNWKAFYQGGMIYQLLIHTPIRSIFLALGYAALSLVVLVLITAPMFFPQIAPALSGLSAEEGQQFLQRYFLWVGLAGFWLFVVLKVVAARIYARGLAKISRTENLDDIFCNTPMLKWLNSLHPQETLNEDISRWRPAVVGRTACGIISIVLIGMTWAGVSLEIYVAEFLNYHPIRGFLNHPLIHLPWFSYA